MESREELGARMKEQVRPGSCRDARLTCLSMTLFYMQ